MRALLPALLVVALAACDTVGDADNEIVRYTGPEITEADATAVDETGQPRRWSAAVLHGWTSTTVTLTQSVLCGDECKRTVSLRFDDGDGTLPASVEGTVRVQNFLPSSTQETEIEVARVEIQDWGPTVYSGILYPVPEVAASTAPIVFWTDEIVSAAE